jgi:hypothetical protein
VKEISMDRWLRRAAAVAMVGWAYFGAVEAHAQEPPSAPPAVQKLGPNRLRIGEIQIDTARREVSVAGKVNDVMMLEWMANTRGGMKAYESFVTVEADAISFNTALILIGLDKSRSKPPTRHFDPATPVGDPVEITIEWTAGGQRKRIPMDQVLWDREKNEVPPSSGWVYTGSQILDGGTFWADVDGVLIGFVHSPAPVIEQVSGVGVGRFGKIVPNPNIGLPPETPVTLIVRNLTPAPKR